jgi:hypothetical protein
MTSYILVDRPTPDTPSANRAFLISMALYALSHPGGVRSLEDTLYSLAVITHPETGDGALEVPEQFELPIHPQADLSTLLDLFQSTVTSQESAQMQAVLALARTGQPGSVVINVANLIPSSMNANKKTRSQMVELGWFTQIP